MGGGWNGLGLEWDGDNGDGGEDGEDGEDDDDCDLDFAMLRIIVSYSEDKTEKSDSLKPY